LMVSHSHAASGSNCGWRARVTRFHPAPRGTSRRVAGVEFGGSVLVGSRVAVAVGVAVREGVDVDDAVGDRVGVAVLVFEGLGVGVNDAV